MTETKVEERLVSGTGVLRVPALENATRYVSLLCDVIRQPGYTFRSFKYSPYRQRYGTLVFLRKEYVIAEEAIDYTRRRFDFVLDVSGQTLIALKCAHKQTLQQLGSAVSNIATFPNLNMLWDEVRLVCQDDTAFQLRLFVDTYSECGDDYYEKSPPPPPPPLPPSTPGVPIADISPPYEGDDVTQPFPGDTIPEPDPEGGDTGDTSPDRIYSVAYSYRQFPGGSVITQGGISVRGPVGDVRFKPGDPNHMVQIWCRGRVPNIFDPPPPGALTWYDVQEQGLTATDLNKVSVNDVTP